MFNTTNLTFPGLIILLLLVTNLNAQKLPPIPKADSVQFNSKDSIYQYYRKGKLVLWKSYRTGSMSYLPGQAIGGGYDSAYLFITPTQWHLFTYQDGTNREQVLSPYSLLVTTRSFYKGKEVESGKYLVHRDANFYPQWLNMPLTPIGLWKQWNSWTKTVKRINYDTVFRFAPSAKYAVGTRERILQAADSVLRKYLGDTITSTYVRLLPWYSSVLVRNGNESAYPLLPEKDPNAKILSATLSYEIRLSDSLRFATITMRFDSAGYSLFNRNMWSGISDLGVPTLKPQARYFNRSYLLQRAATYGIKNDSRTFWNFYLYKPYGQPSTYRIVIMYLNDPAADPPTYKQLIIDAATGEETFNPAYQVEFETIAPPVEG